MQERQTNRELYFEELAATSKKYFIPYISEFKKIERGMSILEIGCGDGGNLLPFAEMGCDTTGVDISSGRIEDAIRFFRKRSARGTFIASDIFKMKELEHKFDLVICHDVLEHIADKTDFPPRCPNTSSPEASSSSRSPHGRCLSEDTSRYAGAKPSHTCPSCTCCPPASTSPS